MEGVGRNDLGTPRFGGTARGYAGPMKRIVVAAKAGAEQPWLADAAADLAEEIGADVAVVSMDGMELEALSTVPRSELARGAEAAASQVAERIGKAGIPATAEHRAGPVVPGVLVFAEEQDADLIVVGATSRSAVARRVLGTITTRLVERSRRPVLVITPPPAA
jgi:nucleotide-binding universal stress UspA family protein